MAVPYFLMVFLYLSLAALTEFVFGTLPFLVEARTRHPQPRLHWNTWLFLNAGIVLLLLGVPLMNFLLVTTGGTLVFLAALLLIRQLRQHKPGDRYVEAGGLTAQTTGQQARKSLASGGLKFYLAGLAYLLTGILVGTGLWQGWSGPLRIAIPKEVHVHANLWGFTALVFAGLLVDLSPSFTRQKVASTRWVEAVFWLMALGALGLVLGPWFDIDLLQVAGLVLHTAGSLLLLARVFRPLLKEWRSWHPGLWHLLVSYIWFFLPVVVAPLVVVQRGVGTEVAGNGGPILIFGWILQFIYAVVPYLLRETTRPGRPLHLGGTWLSLAAINAGSVIYWASLFTRAYQAPLRGVAFLLWLVSLLPILVEIAGILKAAPQANWQENSDLSR